MDAGAQAVQRVESHFCYTENPPHDHLRDAHSEPTPASAGVWEPRLS